MRHMRLSVSLFLAVWVILASSATTASAGPPKIGQSASSWVDRFWPSPVTAPSEPAFFKSTRAGLSRTWNGVQQTTRSAWARTKYALRPYDTPPKRGRSQAKRSGGTGGFWSNLFGGEPQDEQLTVNDFLRQPAPQ